MAGSLRPLQLELESVSAVTASTLRQAWRLLPVSFRDIFWAVVSYLQVSTPVNYRRHNSANLNTEIEATVSNADVIRSMLSGWGLQLSSISLLEVGPGPNFGAQLLLSQYGARVTVADRFLAQWDQTYHPLFYSRLRDRIGGDTSLLDAVIVANAYLPEAITLVAAPAETLSGIPDSSIDVVSSNAVLEHVYDLEAACRMFARVTKKGGINSHQVDFRDHSNFDKPLEFLLEGYIASKFIFIKKRGERGNRFRPSELIRFMQSAGFKTVEVDINLTADEAYLRDVDASVASSTADIPASGAAIVPILRLLYRTVFGQFSQPIRHACVAAAFCNQRPHRQARRAGDMRGILSTPTPRSRRAYDGTKRGRLRGQGGLCVG
jgi:SAM-dependent methyltransferase